MTFTSVAPSRGKVGVVGAGTMGCFNSLAIALAGYEVLIHDPVARALEGRIERLHDFGQQLVLRGACTREQFHEAADRIFPTGALEAMGDVMLVSECVPERLELKRQVLRAIEDVAPEDAMLTTSASMLLPSDIAEGMREPRRLVAMHFHQPTPLVDVMAGKGTPARERDRVRDFVSTLGMVPVVMRREKVGYLHNTLFNAVVSRAQVLHVRGVPFEDIDRAWMISQREQLGPFGMLDYVGLDVVHAIATRSASAAEAPTQIHAAVVRQLESRIERGRLGMKSGAGFYDYPSPRFMAEDFTAAGPGRIDVSGDLLGDFFATAVSLVQDGYARRRDVDLCWETVHGAPGPFAQMDALDGAQVSAVLARARVSSAPQPSAEAS